MSIDNRRAGKGIRAGPEVKADFQKVTILVILIRGRADKGSAFFFPGL
jgi:hypothetical protein